MAFSHLLGTGAIRRSIVRWSVLYRSRGQNGELFVGISSLNALNSSLQTVPQIFYRIQVRNCEDNGRMSTSFALNRFCTMTDLCLWPLSCWNIHPVGIFFLGKRKYVLLQYLLVNISVHTSINTHKGTDAKCTAISPYSSRSTTVLDGGHLVFWVESGTHQTSNPPFLTTSKHIKLGFVASKNFRPLRMWSVLMRLRPIFSFGQLFFGDKRFTNPNPTI